MRMEKMRGNGSHRGKAYYIITCKSDTQAEALQELLEADGWGFVNDCLEDNELGLFVDSGKYGEENNLKTDYKAAKQKIAKGH